MTERDRALIVVLRAAQWLLDDVANDLRRGVLTAERSAEARDALVQVAELLGERTGAQ